MVATALLFTLWACHTVPETGRKALRLVPSSQMNAMGVQAFAELRKEAKESQDAAKKAQVTRVGKNIVSAARQTAKELPPVDQWEFVVFDDDEQVNAFALPGGKIGVFTGMWKVARDDNDLGIVLGHEVAHVVAEHGNERASQAILAQAGGVALSVGLAEGTDLSPGTKQAIMTGYGVGATVGVVLPFSRKHESEADHIGLLYAARAGYDPRAAVPFWQRMGAQGGGAPPEFLSTHPNYETRIKNLQSWMPEALAEYRKTAAGQAAGL